jgi:hypothetical protein
LLWGRLARTRFIKSFTREGEREGEREVETPPPRFRPKACFLLHKAPTPLCDSDQMHVWRLCSGFAERVKREKRRKREIESRGERESKINRERERLETEKRREREGEREKKREIAREKERLCSG